MKRNISILSLLSILCGMAFVSCQQENALEGSKYNTIISVRHGDAKTHYHSGSVIWDVNDQINVARGNTFASAPFTFISTDAAGVSTFGGDISNVTEGSYYAIYPAQDGLTINNGRINCVVIPTQQTLTENSFGRGNNTTVGWGTDCDNMRFYNVGGLAKIALRGSAIIKSIKITLPGGTLSGRGTIDIIDGHTVTIWDNTAVDSVVAKTPDPSTGTSINGGKIFYIALPPCQLADYSITITDISGHSTVFYPVVASTITRSHVTYLGVFDMRRFEAFSVSSTQKVRFAPGNLQYIGSAAIPYWKFSDHQYDILGNSNASNAQDVDRDLFGWGTSGYQYNPWLTTSGWGGYPNAIEGTQHDWGVYNPIRYGSMLDPAGTWRTPTKAEWLYLLNDRANAASLKGLGTIGTIQGLILLPDNWSSSVDPDFNTSISNYSNNTYSMAEWITMEDAGAVFLPAAGWRMGSDIYQVTIGNYWSSTSSVSVNASPYVDVSILKITGSAVSVSNEQPGIGRSVRLVQDVGSAR